MANQYDYELKTSRGTVRVELDKSKGITIKAYNEGSSKPRIPYKDEVVKATKGLLWRELIENLKGKDNINNIM